MAGNHIKKGGLSLTVCSDKPDVLAPEKAERNVRKERTVTNTIKLLVLQSFPIVQEVCLFVIRKREENLTGSLS